MIVYTLVIILLITPMYMHYTDPKTKISESVNELIKTGVKPASLDEAIRNLKQLNNKVYKNEQVCNTCNYVVDEFIKYRRSGVEKELMIKLLKDLCVAFSDEGVVGCTGRVPNEIDALLYMIDNKQDLTGPRACAIYFQSYGCTDPGLVNWTIDIPKPLSRNTVQASSNKDRPESQTLKLLHLTDIHFDPLYVPGSNAICDKPMCCREGTPEKPENAAGYWGDYRVCDMPWHSVLDLMSQIKKEHPQIDYVYYTGDIIDHASWSTSREYNENNIKRLFDLFSKSFNATPLFPVLGNHEAHPCDYYSPENVTENVSTQWLFNLVSNDWSKWLPEDTKPTLKQGGFYTVLAKEGFRIIGLNSNLCYKDNAWLMYEDIDPYEQLKWLVNVLEEAEKNNELVHILSHVPPASSEGWHMCFKEFNKVIRRFSHIIKAQFNGHSHEDQIVIYLNDDRTNAINVAYNGASFTTYVGSNPNYRIYDLDSNTYEVIDYEQWIYNLTEANENKDEPPKWYKLYSFKEAYGLNSTSMENLFEWIQRMRGDPERILMKQYDRYRSRDSKHSAKICQNNDCLDDLLCRITSVEYEDALKC